MYCSFCNHQNKEGSLFCEACGKPLPAGAIAAGQSQSIVTSPNIAGLSTGHKVGGSGALLAIICFFLPWIMVSYGGLQLFNISGWQLAVGGTIGQGVYAQQLNGKGEFFLILLPGIIIVALTYMAFKRRTLNFLDGYGLIALGTLPLLFMLIEILNLNLVNQTGLSVDYQFGLWAVVIGYIASIIGGVLNLRKPK